jgi:DNA-binding NarL/FixJ family response regulator
MSSIGRTRVLVADRQPVFLRGLLSVLHDEDSIDVVASCCHGIACIRAIRELSPDVALVDIALPGLSGLEILTTATSERLQTRVLLLSSSLDAWELAALTTRDGHGVIPKDASPESLVRALKQGARCCQRRRLTLRRRRPDREIAHSAPTRTGEHSLASLTERERQIVSLVSEGLSNKEVGSRLDLCDGTIKVHLHKIYQKLAIHNRTALAAIVLHSLG